MPQTTHVASDGPGFPSSYSLVFLVVALSFAAVGVVSRLALLTVLLDAVSAAVIVVPAALGGLWLTPLFRLGLLPRRWQMIFGAALGLGALSILVLLGGLLGLLNRTIWISLLGAAAAAGAVRLWRIRQIARDENLGPAQSDDGSARRWRFLWIVAAPFLTLALLSASNAPGFIWQEEGYGYDILEYHLQLPKEYIQNGAVTYMPHNVYANFPANVEMLYMLAMIVHDDVLDSGTVANMIHLFLAALTVAAAWAIGRDHSPRAGIVCGVLTATTGWLEYLAGLAYVENGMLFFGMCAAGAALRASRAAGAGGGHRSTETPEPALTIRWLALAGVFAGLACGCKYTAAPLIALPLLPVVAILPVHPLAKIKCGLVFVVATLAAFSPWLVKNQLMTGNPVFPLANELFRAAPPGWSAEQTQQWERGHALRPEERTPAARAKSVWGRIAGDSEQRFGPAVLLLGLVGLVFRRRDRADAALAAMLGLQLIVWTFATHEYARFAVPLIIPLAILGGRAIQAPPRPIPRTLRVGFGVWGLGYGGLVAIVIVCGAAWNFAFATIRHARESADGAPASLFYEGRVPGFEYLRTINEELPDDAKVLLVGDARAFYVRRDADYRVAFNRNWLLEMIHDSMDARAIMDRLREKGYTHLLVNWSEVRRLERTYGFAPPATAAELERAIGDLGRAGLSLTSAFAHPDPQVNGCYVELYAIPRNPP